MFLDPHHEVEHVKTQLEDHNTGFVRDFADSFPDSSALARSYVMGYYPLDFLPGLHGLARHFTICDHWFSSLPGPTWPNRFFALTGTSNGRVNMPDDGTHKADLPGYFQQTQDTIFDRLNERAIHWKVYFHDVPQTTVLTDHRQPHNVARYFYIDEFFDDARGHAADFPQFSLVEPAYIGVAENDDHPPHDIMRTEKLIADVYNAIRANEQLWHSTLLIVFFDEHGGFYDHVEPPAAIPPDDRHDEYSFDRLGVRVPALLVSPWVDAGVEKTQFDHTSVLRYVIDKWQLAPLGARAAAANTVAVALTRTVPRENAPLRIELTVQQMAPPDPLMEEQAFGYRSAHHAALALLAAHLKAEAFDEIPRVTSFAARLVEYVKTASERWLVRLLGEPSGAAISIAEPDKVSSRAVAAIRDDVARFVMRKKRYAMLGLRTRLSDPELPPEQREHTLMTLGLITGRKFHHEPAATRFTHAHQWLAQHLGPSQT